MWFEKKVRNLQDSMRNIGWRIQWVPWQDSGKPEYVFNTPLTLFLIIVGIGMFFDGILLTTKVVDAPKFVPISKFNHTWIGIGVIVFGLLVLFVSRIVAAYQKQKEWIKVEATCIDREVAAGRDYSGDGNGTVYWEYRLLCVFNFNGKQYRVTPESSKIVGFSD